MAKIEAIKFNDFMGGKHREKKDIKVIGKILTTSGAIVVATMPKIALAAGMDGTFGNIHGLL
jgi:hypothetical protein